MSLATRRLAAQYRMEQLRLNPPHGNTVYGIQVDHKGHILIQDERVFGRSVLAEAWRRLKARTPGVTVGNSCYVLGEWRDHTGLEVVNDR